MPLNHWYAIAPFENEAMAGNGVVADDLGPPPRLRIGSAVHNGVDEHGLGIGREPHMHRGDVSLDHGPVM